MAPSTRTFAPALLPLALAACGATYAFDQTSDRLALCALSPGESSQYPLDRLEPQTYAALEPLELHVVAAGCEAACVDDLVQSCEVSVEGQVLRVRASFSWSERSGDCVLICAPIKAVCTTPPLPAGQYTVALGTRTTTLTVGGVASAPGCIESAGG
jgi:hypothetical protein